MTRTEIRCRMCGGVIACNSETYCPCGAVYADAGKIYSAREQNYELLPGDADALPEHI